MPVGKIAYDPNSLGGGCPMHSADKLRAYVSHAQPLAGPKVRARSASFADHFTQASLFWRSQSEIEKRHIIDAFSFELSKVESRDVRARMVGNLTFVDRTLASAVALEIGVRLPKSPVVPPSAADPKNPIVPKTRRSGRSGRARSACAPLASLCTRAKAWWRGRRRPWRPSSRACSMPLGITAFGPASRGNSTEIVATRSWVSASATGPGAIRHDA